MKTIPIFFGFLICGLNSILGQNYLFKPNQSGPHFTVQYYNPFRNTFVLNPGYTYNSRLTVGLIGSFTYDFELDNKIFGANAGYMILKEGV